jgi:hypothetical protein
MKADNSAWWITGVYGPQSSAEKLVFLQELSGLAAQHWTKWLALGDFNLIYQASDKNNCNLNQRLMGAFKLALDSLQMKEIHLNGCRYIWSNGQANPTLTRIDRFFYTMESKLLFPSYYLHSLPSLMSDHTLLLLQGELMMTHSPSFCFGIFWVKMEGFKEAVQIAWLKPLRSSFTPMKRLHIKLARAAKAIKLWRKTKVGDTRLHLAISKELILRFETAQEERVLTQEELDLLNALKARALGLAVIEKSRIRQRARLTRIRLDDVNTKFFHLSASSRARKNFIHCLQPPIGNLAVAHEEKEKIIQEHFKSHLGTTPERGTTLNWPALALLQHDLSSLEASFSLEEIKETIFSMASDKAPGSDGFIGLFFKVC